MERATNIDTKVQVIHAAQHQPSLLCNLVGRLNIRAVQVDRMNAEADAMLAREDGLVR